MAQGSSVRDDGQFEFSEGGGDFEPVSPGWHDAILCEFVNLGEQQNPFEKGKTQRRGLLIFQVEEEQPTVTTQDGDPIRKEIWYFFNRHLGTEDRPSNIREFMENWRAEEYSMEDLTTADKRPNIYDFVGKSARVLIKHKNNKAGTKVFAVIKANGPSDTEVEMLDYVPYWERSFNKKDDSSTDDTEVKKTEDEDGFETDDEDIPF